MPVKIHLIAAARPNFMKVAPLYHALKAADWAEPVLVHTGQHYDHNMSDAILRRPAAARTRTSTWASAAARTPSRPAT